MKVRHMTYILSAALFMSSIPAVSAIDSDIMTTPNATFGQGVAIKEDGTLVGWGDRIKWNWNKEWTGDLLPLGQSDCVSVVDRGEFFLKSDGTLWYCGDGGSLLIGDGTVEIQEYVPVQVLSDVVQFSGGVALRSDGTVWGAYETNAPDIEGETKIEGIFYYVTDEVKQISSSSNTNMALKKDGTLYQWDIYWNQGIGQARFRHILDDVAYVDGETAILTDGSLYSWGTGFYGGQYGSIGNGTSAPSDPVKIMDDVVGVWNAGDVRFAMKKDGSLYSWGLNSVGQLGYEGGDSVYESQAMGVRANYQSVPRKVEIEDVISVSTDARTSLFLKKDGSLWGIGSNFEGECGYVTDKSYTTEFVKIMDGVKLPTALVNAGTEAGGKEFSDVKSDAFYYDAVQWAVNHGVTSGTSDTTFSPDANCTRAQIITFLWRAAGSPEPKGTAQFQDVSETAFYAKATQWAKEQGIVSGTEFDPDELCTRAMAVDFLWKFSDMPSAPVTNFTDVPSDYEDAVAWAANHGVTSGTSDTTFSPYHVCTRAQIMTFLYRTIQ